MKITQFIESIKGLSPQTQSAYRQTLYQLDQTVKADEPTADEIKTFLEGYGASSLQRHKAAILNYWEWRFPDKMWPFSKRQFKSVRRRVPKYISPDLVEKIARAGNKAEYWYVWTLFTLGCRISELMGITDQDITDQGVLVIMKGGEQRLKPAMPEFISELRRYAGRKKGRIFPEKYSYYYAKLRELGKKVGVEDIHPHMLRHSRAVDLLRKKMPPAFVQQFLGHQNFNTTAIYLEIDSAELNQELQKVEKANGNQQRS